MTTHDRARLVSALYLKDCVLWPGSIMEQAFRFSGGITAGTLIDKAASLRDCDDRTPNEDELLAAIERTLLEAGYTS